MVNMVQKTALVTGSAGFIGYHAALRLLKDGWSVIGLDAMTDYYDVALKRARHAQLQTWPGFHAHEDRLEAPGCLHDLMEIHRPNLVLHLAAQAGVRHSIDAPGSYVTANLEGTFALLEAMRAFPPNHALLASTSSVYGANPDLPYAETDRTDQPMSFYAATKKANEAMAHSYAHLYGLSITMFRFFTVYGPWGRPDMALFKFTRAILEGTPIDVYNHGRMRRDFTYIDDLIEAVVRLADAPPAPGAPGASPVAPHRIVNIGNAEPVELGAFIAAIETATGRTATRNMMDIQPGDVPATWADTALLQQLTGFSPGTPVVQGVERFVEWYRAYYEV